MSAVTAGEGNGKPLQYSCLHNPRDRGAWWAAVNGVAQSWTRLKWLSSSSSCYGCCTGTCAFSAKPQLLNGLCLPLHSHWKQGREVYSRPRGGEVHLPSECWVSELMTFYKWGWNQIQCQTSSQQWSQRDIWQVDYYQAVLSLVTVITLLIQFFGNRKISIGTFFSF